MENNVSKNQETPNLLFAKMVQFHEDWLVAQDDEIQHVMPYILFAKTTQLSVVGLVSAISPDGDFDKCPETYRQKFMGLYESLLIEMNDFIKSREDVLFDEGWLSVDESTQANLIASGFLMQDYEEDWVSFFRNELMPEFVSMGGPSLVLLSSMMLFDCAFRNFATLITSDEGRDLAFEIRTKYANIFSSLLLAKTIGDLME